MSVYSTDQATAAAFREMRARILGIFEHAMAECSVPRAFSQRIHRQGDLLHIEGNSYDLRSFNGIRVISIGKAAHTMAVALASITDAPLEGIVACPDPPRMPLPGFRYFAGGHPLPNEQSLAAADAILKLVAKGTERSLAVFLISGGASAIAEKPISDTIILDDVVATYKALVHSGAPIAEINTIRKHLSALKGGRLAQVAAPAQQVSVLVSDVPEKSLDALASGPTMPDSTTVADCYAIAEHYKLTDAFPSSVVSLFAEKLLQETPKASDGAFDRSRYVTVLSNATAVAAASEQAKQDGFTVAVDNSCDDRDYKSAADYLLRRLRELRQRTARVCLISGGEVTVKVGAQSGVGGRNQQFAAYCAVAASGQNITVLSAGTDGIDGNSPAAGGIADGTTAARARRRDLDVMQALAKFDTYPLFDALGDSIMTGPTGNNVRDLRILMAY